MSTREPTMELPRYMPPSPDSAEQDIRAMLASYRQASNMGKEDVPGHELLAKRSVQLEKFRVHPYSLPDILVAFAIALTMLGAGIIVGLML